MSAPLRGPLFSGVGAAAGSGLVRVTVASATRRVDLVLPAAVPVAELVPELARSVSVLGAVRVHGGYRLVTAGGDALVADCGLAVQGVEDGAVITIVAGVDDAPPRRYDDVVEAMADAMDAQLRPWTALSGRRTAWSAGVLLLLLGAVGLVLQHDSRLAATAAVVTAVVLVLGAVTLARARCEAGAALMVGWTGCAYAAAAGAMLGWSPSLLGGPAAAAGAGTVGAAVGVALGLVDSRALMLPPAVTGAAFLVTGLLATSSPYDPAVALTATLAVVTISGSALPWLALALTATTRGRTIGPTALASGPEDVDVGRITADARVAHEILVALSAAVGLLLVLVAPLAVSLGTAGTVVSLLACAAVMLRVRAYRSHTEVLVGLASGVLGLTATALSALALHPLWRTSVCLALAGAGLSVLALTWLPIASSARRGRLGDVAETLALLGLLPALVLAAGVRAPIPG